MRDANFRALLAFTLVYGLFSIGMIAAQPREAAALVADAGGNFEAAPAEFGGFKYRLASAE
jgi:hypothetical protein